MKEVADGQLTAKEKEGLESDVEEIAEACIRCEKGTKEGTQGFFVVAFVRDEGSGGTSEDGDRGHQQSSSSSLVSLVATDDAAEEEEAEEEWEGFAE